jgi:hypothetical protein
MPDIVFVRVDWDNQAFSLPLPGIRMHRLHVDPEPAHPFGRKGLILASAWEQLRTPSATGMLILDGDVAIDLYDLSVMLAAINKDPAVVHAAPARLWPRSTGRTSWVWSVWDGEQSQELPETPAFTTFCFTYLPALLLARCVRAGLKQQRFPHVDSFVSAKAAAAGIPIRIVPDAAPKHLQR